MTEDGGFRKELARIRRVSDMMCTAHAGLHQRFHRRALFVDMTTLSLASWLIALSFVDRETVEKLSPFDVEGRFWMGFLSLGTFFLTLIQLKTGWKGKAVAHKRSLEMYAAVKREIGYLFASDSLDEQNIRRLISSYDIASAAGEVIPENDFLIQKKRHSQKVELSRHLDDNPFASLLVTRICFWWRDNVKRSNGSAG